jgi:isochorismate synthase
LNETASARIRRTIVARGPNARSIFEAASVAAHAQSSEATSRWQMNWHQPSERRSMAALGCVISHEDAHEERFQSIARRMQQTLVIGAAQDDPLWFGGFAFHTNTSSPPWSDWPVARFFSPRLLWLDDARGGRLIAAWRCDEQGLSVSDDEELTRELLVTNTTRDASTKSATTTPSATTRATRPPQQPTIETAEQWTARVRQARKTICDGALDKVVLARLRSLELQEQVDPVVLAEQLASQRPHCSSFALTFGGSSFVGSTPETLVRHQGPWIRAEALAGSAPRAAEPSADATNRAALSSSTKDLCEHAIVIEALELALKRAGLSPRRSGTPCVVPFPEAFHLRTIITAHPPEGFHLFDAAAAAHPSPAVCGTPTEPAWERLAEEEPWRGWYAGALGWADRSGNGHLVVALRSALVEARRAWCFAGAGIVGDSDPDVELAETEMKFSVMQNLLSKKADDHAA